MTGDRFTWQEGDLTQDPEDGRSWMDVYEDRTWAARQARRDARERWVCEAPPCEACRKRPATHGSLCDDCATTIDRDYEQLRDERDLWGDPWCE